MKIRVIKVHNHVAEDMTEEEHECYECGYREGYGDAMRKLEERTAMVQPHA